ncbi:MAG: HupE/UreJ family protein [Pseudomonadota bacterium]
MPHPLIGFFGKLLFFAPLSILSFLPVSNGALAHEVQPTIADLALAPDGSVTMELRLNVEAFLAGVDLDDVTDTNEDAASGDYDALRALDAAALGAQLPDLIAAWNAHPLAEAGAALSFAIVGVTIPEDVDFELPRQTELLLSAPLTADTSEIIVNWPDGAGALVLRQQGVDAPYTGYLDGGESSPAIAFAGGGAQSPTQAFANYIPVGFDHILPKGLDHILFVLGLFFLSTRWGPLLWQISAFTLAHTVTLALGALGLVNVPGSIVEPLIAASIVYVAIENVFMQGKLSRWRPLFILGFGLLHGLGFASVLSDFGLPEDQFIPALIGFNVGVELGQLTVIALAALLLMLCVRLARRANLPEAEEAAASYPVMFRAVSLPASLTIAGIGAYWSIERVFF